MHPSFKKTWIMLGAAIGSLVLLLIIQEGLEPDVVVPEKTESERIFEMELELAQSGDAQAQYDLGVSYANGVGTARNFEEAARWFQLAADQGVAEAQNNLGALYKFGFGVEKDLGMAAMLFAAASKQGNHHAQMNLGDAYFYGQGVEQSDERALDMYLAASEGSVDGIAYKVGYMFEMGLGTPMAPQIAAVWYQMGMDSEDGDATNALGRLYASGASVLKDEARAIELWLKAAEFGSDEAHMNLATAYKEGNGVEQDNFTALLWMVMAAAQDYPPAFYAMNDMKEEMGEAAYMTLLTEVSAAIQEAQAASPTETN